MKRSEFFGKLAIVPACALGAHELDPKNDKEFCRELKQWANDYVGGVGEPTKCFKAITGEPYTCYGWGFKSRKQLLADFKDLIRGLVDTERKIKKEYAVKLLDEEPLKIYWRRAPTISDWLQGSHPIVGDYSFKKFSVRLCISRAKYVDGVKRCAPNGDCSTCKISSR